MRTISILEVRSMNERNQKLGKQLETTVEYIKNHPCASLLFEAKKLQNHGYGSAGYIDEKIQSLKRAIQDLEMVRDEITFP
jgi:hypothetical protein